VIAEPIPLTSHPAMSSPFNSTPPAATPIDTGSRRSSSAELERDRGDSRVSTRSDGSTTGSLRISSNQKLTNFCLQLVGRKNNDYHSDAPTMQHPSEANINTRDVSSRSGMSRGNFASYRLGGEGGHSAASGATCWSRCCGSFSCLAWPAESRRYFLGRIIQSRSWKFILVVFTLLLLFGPQIRDMYISKDGDTAMDVIFMCALVFFTLDILIRIDVEPNYFSFDLFCRRGQRKEGSSDLATGWMGCGSYGLGSFLFWCDVVSTLTLLHEISFINREHFDEIHINIRLDRFGVPVRSYHGSFWPVLLLFEPLSSSIASGPFSLAVGGRSRYHQRSYCRPDGRDAVTGDDRKNSPCGTLHPFVYGSQDLVQDQLVLALSSPQPSLLVGDRSTQNG
jgi:hypothetical protein